jgi:hypothetical protein
MNDRAAARAGGAPGQIVACGQADFRSGKRIMTVSYSIKSEDIFGGFVNAYARTW